MLSGVHSSFGLARRAKHGGIFAAGFLLATLHPLAHAADVQLFWTDNPGIGRSNTLDHVVRRVVSDALTSSGIDVAGGYIYWTDHDRLQVLRTPVGVGSSTVLYQGPLLASLVDVAVDPLHGKIYWTDGQVGTITQANLDGSDPQLIITTSFFNRPGAIIVDSDSQRLYWSAYPGGIFAADTDGANMQHLVNLGASSSVADMAIDESAQKLYWTDFRESSISRVNLDGTDVEKILQFPTFSDPKGIDVDPVGSKLYWVLGDGQKIQRANLDGSQVEDVLVGLPDPLRLALLAVPEPDSVALAACAACVINCQMGRRRRRGYV